MSTTPDPMAAEAEIVITRSFAAPQTLVWRVFTEADHLAQWWGPASATVKVAALDLQPGGMFLYSMETPQGAVMWGRFVYREIVPPERLVYVNAFSDEAGNATRNPWAPVWPLEILNTLTLSEEHGRTTVTIRGGPINATPEEVAAFAANHANLQTGFKGTFDQLERYLEGVNL